MNARHHVSPRAFALEVVQTLSAAGYQALWAGGCVRDQILGVTPKDYDVATNATPQQVRQVFKRKRMTLPVGEAFGVIMVCGPQGAGQIEIATFRRDTNYSDGRRPDSVIFSSAEEDARRRDFTINGLFFDPLAGKTIDYVEGEKDIQHRVVRAIGNPQERFAEDKLRMLRAVRFTATLDFEMDLPTLQAIQSRPEDILIVSAERIGMELRHMLRDKSRARALQLLHESGLLACLIPEITQAFTEEENLRTTAAVFQTLGETEFSTAMAALLKPWFTHEGDIQAVGQLCRRLKLTNQEQRSIEWMLTHFEAISQADTKPWPLVQRLLIQDDADALVRWAAVEAETNGWPATGPAFCRQRLSLLPHDLNPPPILTGHDLHKRKIPAGKIFKEILDAVRDAQLDGRIDSQAAAWELVDQIYRR